MVVSLKEIISEVVYLSVRVDNTIGIEIITYEFSNSFPISQITRYSYNIPYKDSQKSQQFTSKLNRTKHGKIR